MFERIRTHTYIRTRTRAIARTHMQIRAHNIDNHANNLVYWHPLRRASTRRFSIRVFLINPFVIKQRDQRSVILGQIYSHQSSEIFHSPGRKKECGKEKKTRSTDQSRVLSVKKKTDKNIVIFATVLANNCDDIKGWIQNILHKDDIKGYTIWKGKLKKRKWDKLE